MAANGSKVAYGGSRRVPPPRHWVDVRGQLRILDA